MYRPDEPTGASAAAQPAPAPILLIEAANPGGPPARLDFVGRIKRWGAELLFEFSVPADATETDIKAAAWQALADRLVRADGWRMALSRIAGARGAQ